jgi:hypothetical protein
VLPGAVASYVAAGRTEFELLKSDLRARIKATSKGLMRPDADIEQKCSSHYLDPYMTAARAKFGKPPAATSFELVDAADIMTPLPMWIGRSKVSTAPPAHPRLSRALRRLPAGLGNHP